MCWTDVCCCLLLLPQLAQGCTPEQIRAAVANQHVEFVMTAHPTQAARRTMLMKLDDIAKLLEVGDRPDLTEKQKARVQAELHRLILACWRTNSVQTIKPTPVGEAKVRCSCSRVRIFLSILLRLPVHWFALVNGCFFTAFIWLSILLVVVWAERARCR